jgi:hypothetical protein
MVLVQIGLFDASALTVAVSKSALKVLDSSLPINTLIGRASRDQSALNL